MSGWRRASFCASNECLEWRFRKSPYSLGNGDCTEAALRDGTVLVRDSKMAPRPGHEGPAGPVLAFTPAAWAAFLAGVRAA